MYMYKHSYLRLPKAAPGPHIVPDGRLLAAAHLGALFRALDHERLGRSSSEYVTQSSAQQVASVCELYAATEAACVMCTK